MLKERGVGNLKKKQHLGLAVSGDALSATEGYFGPLCYVYSSQHRKNIWLGLDTFAA